MFRLERLEQRCLLSVVAGGQPDGWSEISPAGPVAINEIMYQAADGDPAQQYVELLGRQSPAVSLAGWELGGGVEFEFPDVALDQGDYLLVVADVDAFQAAHPGVPAQLIVGQWSGQLGDDGDRIELVDDSGELVDRVAYSDEGDWAIRQAEPDGHGHQGWLWRSVADGTGKSLEVVQADLPNDNGQNWAPSGPDGGTPGAANSTVAADLASLVLDVRHEPAVPRSSDPVTVTARVVDELPAAAAVTLYYRADDPAAPFTALAMHDNGQPGDAMAGDGVYSATIPAGDSLSFPTGEKVVEFYVEASDGSQVRSWPAPAQLSGDPADLGQATNALYVIDDTFTPGASWNPEDQPLYYLVMTQDQRSQIDDVGADDGDGDHLSEALFHGALVSVDGTGTEIRYNVGIGGRGKDPQYQPPDYRVNIPRDVPWKDATRRNVAAQAPYSQIAGGAIFRRLQLPAATAVPVGVRVNGDDLADPLDPMFGSYASVEPVGVEWAEGLFPGDVGSLYTIDSPLQQADLTYLGTDPQSYRDAGYANAAGDWADLIHLTDVLTNVRDATYADQVADVLDVDQWLTWFAVHSILGYDAEGLATGRGDDFSLVAGSADGRFQLVPHDLDSLFTAAADAPVLRAADATLSPQINYFLTHPDIVGRYYATLEELATMAFAPEQIAPLLDRVLGDRLPAGEIDAIKAYLADRVDEVLMQIPQEFRVNVGLPSSGDVYLSPVDVAALDGTADATRTQSVLVAGELADWSPLDGTWSIGETSGGGPPQTFSFQDGAAYSGTQDTEIRDTSPDTDRGTNTSFKIDGESSGAVVQALLRFDDLFGTGAGQVPTDADITNATLLLDITNDGNSVALHRMLTDWNESSTWNTLVGGIQTDDVEAAASADVSVDASSTGIVSVDVTAAVQAWQADPTSNFGWALMPTGTDGVDVHASDYTTDPADRPELQITTGGGQAIDGVALRAGVNRLLVQAFDGPNGTGEQIEQDYVDVAYDDGTSSTISSTLTGASTVLDAAGSPWRVTGDVTVPAGHTLTIEPGTTVYFDQGTGITVDGRMVAEGTQHERIRLGRRPGTSDTWDGLSFSSTEDNRLAYLDMDHATAGSRSVRVSSSKIVIDNVTWSGTTETVLSISNSSLIVRDSVFPGTNAQTVSGSGLLSSDPYMLFENNVFGICTGHKQDVVDFTSRGSATRPQFIGNVFLGGGDDALDFDGTNAYVEGNLFMNFHRNFTPTEGESYGISTGYDGSANSNHVIVRNTFIDCDNAALVKDQSWIRFENNTLINCANGINFKEPLEDDVDPGLGGYLDGNLFWQTPLPFDNYLVDDPVWGSTDITVNRSIIPAAYHHFGTGNIDEDPRLADLAGEDFGLLPGSPALGAGPNGIDIGAMVPAGPSISGEPPALTPDTSATLVIAGPGVSHYKYRLNGGPWSAEATVDVAIELVGLADGTYTVDVLGRSEAGVWQEESQAASSKTWTVDNTLSRVRISEVLAINETAAEHNGQYPGMIELVNDGAVSVNLAGMGLTDDPSDPTRFVFPAETWILPGEFLVLYADGQDVPGELHPAISLDGGGDGVYLYAVATSGGGLLDSVEFGLQVPDLSIGRAGHFGDWTLTQPSFGAANQPVRTGDPASLRINEWLAEGTLPGFDPFVELHNADPLPVSIAGLYLSDNPVGQPAMHEIAPLSFVAGEGFAAFAADGNPDAGPDHLGFSLSPQQGALGLYAADLAEIDQVVYFPQTANYSEGRVADGYDFLLPPTPGLSNEAGVTIVAGRHLFYNNSVFDGRDPAADARDDLAIAPDKAPLFAETPGPASFVNYTSYSRGINGIMIDVAGLPDGATLTAADFEFHVGNDDTPDDWTPLAAMPEVDVRVGDGDYASDRITLTWPDGAVTDTWFQIKVKANANTGLTDPDVFYFGNALGESGNSLGDAMVTSIDEIAARHHPQIFTAAAVDNHFDFNRDGKVTAVDQIIARHNAAVFDSLELIDLSGSAPAPPPPAAVETAGGASSHEASWLLDFDPYDTDDEPAAPSAAAIDALLASLGQ